MGYKELRKEFESFNFRKEMKNKLGKACANCGATEHVQYHHVVPLKNGGTNNLGNIVPLCEECHCKAHNKIHRNLQNSGRKHKKTYEECLPYMEKYFNLEIGAKEVKEMCGFSQNTKLTTTAYFKRYRAENNIPKDFRNNIDLLASQGKRIISYLETVYHI